METCGRKVTELKDEQSHAGWTAIFVIKVLFIIECL